MARSLTRREDWPRDSGGCALARVVIDSPLKSHSSSRHSQPCAQPIKAVIFQEFSRTDRSAGAESPRSLMPLPGDGQPG